MKDLDLDSLTRLLEAKAAVYGDPAVMHEAIAKCWGALLSVEVTPWQVALMMTMMKILRMKYVFVEDNYVDARAYLGFAREFQEKDSRERGKE